jgi:hypothetical protein
MDKAKKIHRDNLRGKRKKHFEELDAQWMKSMAQGDAAAAAGVEAKRQELRDAPAHPAIDLAESVEDLKAAVPACLAKE